MIIPDLRSPGSPASPEPHAWRVLTRDPTDNRRPRLAALSDSITSPIFPVFPVSSRDAGIPWLVWSPNRLCIAMSESGDTPVPAAGFAVLLRLREFRLLWLTAAPASVAALQPLLIRPTPPPTRLESPDGLHLQGLIR